MTPRTQWIAGIIVAAALMRILPHPYNFTPIAAMSLFSGATLGRRWAMAAPLLAMLFSDLALELLYRLGLSPMWGLHRGMLFVYPAFLVIVAIGYLIRDQRRQVGALLGATLGASLFFFLFTNLGVWALSGLYPHSGAGLLAAYIAALPFYGATLTGDLLYSGIFFGAYAWAERRFFAPAST